MKRCNTPLSQIFAVVAKITMFMTLVTITMLALSVEQGITQESDHSNYTQAFKAANNGQWQTLSNLINTQNSATLSDQHVVPYLLWLCDASPYCASNTLSPAKIFANDTLMSKQSWPKLNQVRKKIEALLYKDLRLKFHMLPLTHRVRAAMRAQLSLLWGITEVTTNAQSLDTLWRDNARRKRVSPPSWTSINTWFARYPPLSNEGMIAHFLAQVAQNSSTATDILRKYWLVAQFDIPQQKWIIERFSPRLNMKDHLWRIELALMRDDIGTVNLLTPILDKSSQTLIKQRVNINKEASNLEKTVANRAPQKSYSNTSIVTQLGEYWLKKDDENRAASLLEYLEKDSDINERVPPPLRDYYHKKRITLAEDSVRYLITQKNFSKADKILSAFDQTGKMMVLRGWLLLRKNNQPQKALSVLQQAQNYKEISTPQWEPQRLYWLAQAILASDGNNNTTAIKKAQKWLQKACAFKVSFYGILALQQAKNTCEHVRLNDENALSNSFQASFNSEFLVVLARKLIRIGQDAHARNILYTLARSTSDPQKITAIANLAIALGEHSTAVRIAVRARSARIILTRSGYPWHLDVANFTDIDQLLVMSVIRQESGFNPSAISRSGAKGLMQLMPATARYIASLNGIKYQQSHLISKPKYNISLGVSYLQYLLRRYNGNIYYTLSAYNGGPTNTDNWIIANGNPSPQDTLAVVDWIESIPKDETRDYVKKVMSNHTVYQQLRSHLPISLKLITDIPPPRVSANTR